MLRGMAVSRHRQLSRGLEDDALDAVVRALTEDGRIVGQVRRPDRELDLRADLSRRPDGLADVDGEPTAFDVTLFATDEAQMRTAARVDELKAHASPLIRAVAPSELIAILVHYHLGDAALLSMKRAMRDRTAERLATAIGDALALGRLRTGGPDVYMDEIHPALRITVGAPISPSSGVMWASAPEGPRLEVAVPPWLRTTISKKEGQHEGWGRGVLVVVALWDEDADELAEGLARHVREGGVLPWWRVYLVGFARDTAILVWPRRADGLT